MLAVSSVQSCGLGLAVPSLVPRMPLLLWWRIQPTSSTTKRANRTTKPKIAADGDSLPPPPVLMDTYLSSIHLASSTFDAAYSWSRHHAKLQPHLPSFSLLHVVRGWAPSACTHTHTQTHTLYCWDFSEEMWQQGLKAVLARIETHWGDAASLFTKL